MDIRALIFAIWIKSGKNRTATLTALESMASGQLDVFNRGGKTMVSSSVGSESFTVQLSGVLAPDAVQSMAYSGWRAVTRLADDSALSTWLQADEVQSMRAAFDNVRDF